MFHFISNSLFIQNCERFELANSTKYIALSLFIRCLTPHFYFNDEKMSLLKLCSLKLAAKVSSILFSSLKLHPSHLHLTQSSLYNQWGFRDLLLIFSNLSLNNFASWTSTFTWNPLMILQMSLPRVETYHKNTSMQSIVILILH